MSCCNLKEVFQVQVKGRMQLQYRKRYELLQPSNSILPTVALSALQYRKRYELLQHYDGRRDGEFKELQYRKRYELLQINTRLFISDSVTLQYRKRYELLQRHHGSNYP